MINIKKITLTPFPISDGQIVDSFETLADKHTNSPSLSAVENKIKDNELPYGSILEWDDNEPIPEGYEEVLTTPEIFVIHNESELIGLEAEQFDLAQLVETVGGEQTVTSTWQLIDVDPTIRANWVAWATTADNSMKINGNSIICMTQEEYDTAYSGGTLLDNTFYFVKE